MFVNSTNASSPASNLTSNLDTLNEKVVRKRLKDIACKKMQEICTDNKSRLENCKSDVQLLSGGIFYPHEYYAALKEVGQNEEIERLRKKDSFYYGFVSNEHFTIDISLGAMLQNGCGSFILREGVLPSEALKAVVKGPSLILCGVVCQIARLLALQEVLGTEKFDALLASDSSTPLKIGLNCPISRVLKFEKEKGVCFSWIKRGDLVKFPNHYLYRTKHRIGISGAYNTLCIDKEIAGTYTVTPKFTSLGISGKGITDKQMNKLLIDEFNPEPDYALEYLAEETRNVVAKTFNLAAKDVTLQDLFVSKFEICSRFDSEKVTALANSTLERARELLDRWSF